MWTKKQEEKNAQTTHKRERKPKPEKETERLTKKRGCAEEFWFFFTHFSISLSFFVWVYVRFILNFHSDSLQRRFLFFYVRRRIYDECSSVHLKKTKLKNAIKKKALKLNNDNNEGKAKKSNNTTEKNIEQNKIKFCAFQFFECELLYFYQFTVWNHINTRPTGKRTRNKKKIIYQKITNQPTKQQRYNEKKASKTIQRMNKKSRMERKHRLKDWRSVQHTQTQ